MGGHSTTVYTDMGQEHLGYYGQNIAWTNSTESSPTQTLIQQNKQGIRYFALIYINNRFTVYNCQFHGENVCATDLPALVKFNTSIKDA